MSTATFIQQLYTKFLGRSPDTAGLAYWVELIDSNKTNAAEATQQFIDSQEFTNQVSPIAQLYYAALGRIPDAEGLLYWIYAYQNGTPLNEISGGFIQSAEFQNTYGDLSENSDFLDLLFENVFNRASDSEGKNFWLSDMANGMTRAEVVTGFANSIEFALAKGEDIKVLLKYHGILGIQPTQEEIDAAKAANNPIELISQLYANNSYKGEVVPGLTTSGVVVDGYISGATVFIDSDGDGVHDPDEVFVTTDALGNFDFGDKAGFGTLVMYGGIDISTGQAFEGSMTAPSGSSVVNPLTSLINNMAKDGTISIQDATANLLTSLGLDSDVDLLNFDPIAEAANTDRSAEEQAKALAIQAAAVQVNTLVSQAAALLTGVGITQDESNAIDAVYKAMAGALKNGIEGEFNLSSNSTIKQLIKSSADAAGADEQEQQKLESLSTDASQAISNLNKGIENAVKDNSNLDEALAEIAALQILAENVENEMEQGAESGDVSATVDSTDGEKESTLPKLPPLPTGGGGSADTSGPLVVNGPSRISDTNISLTIDEDGTAGIYNISNSSLIGSSINLTENNSGNLVVAPQNTVTYAKIKLIDAVNNTSDSSKVTLGTIGSDYLSNTGFVFGFDGSDTISKGKGNEGASIIDGGAGADTIRWTADSASELAAKVGSTTGVDIDFSSGSVGDDIIFVSGADKLHFEQALLTNATGQENNTLLKITKGGVVTNTARFVHITDTEASDNAEQFGGAQSLLNGLDTSAVAIGDSFIAAIDNDTDTYIYLVEQVSASDTVAAQDMSLIGRLNGITDIADGDFVTIDTAYPYCTDGPIRVSPTEISLTVNETASAGIYSTSGPQIGPILIGSSINLTEGNPGILTVTAQANSMYGYITVTDTAGHSSDVKSINLGTHGNDELWQGSILFGFGGDDTLSSRIGGASIVDGGSGADTYEWRATSASAMATVVGADVGVDADFGAGIRGDDIIFESGIDKLRFEEDLLSNAIGAENNTLLKITQGGTVSNSARFVHITDAQASDQAEQFGVAQAILNGLDTSAVAPGDSFIAAIDNDSHIYLYLIEQVSAAGTIAAQDLTLIGRLNGVTNVVDGDFVTLDTTPPSFTTAPSRASASEISLTVNETATAGIYSGATLIGSNINLLAGVSNNISVTAQSSAVVGKIKLIDALNNWDDTLNVVLGTDGDDNLPDETAIFSLVHADADFIFGFGGADTITHGSGANIIDGGSGADIIKWNSTSAGSLVYESGINSWESLDFSSGVRGDDIIFVSGEDRLQFGKALLTNASGTESDSLLEITKGGIVSNTARFVQITDAVASEHAEQISGAQVLLNALDTSAVGIGDSFIAAIDNDTDTYLYLVEQASTPDTITAQDMTLIGRLNSVTDIADGDFFTEDISAPLITNGPKYASATEISLTVNETATAGIYSNSTIVGSTINLTANTPGNLTVGPQSSTTGAIIKIKDTADNSSYASLMELGTTGDDILSTSGFVFGFDGADTINSGKGYTKVNAASIIDGGLGADTINIEGTTVRDVASAVGSVTGSRNEDFSSGEYGYDMYFESGIDKLQFDQAVLTNATGIETDALLKITKGGIVTNTARFVHITDAEAADQAEQFSGAQNILNGLDTSAIAIGDSFIAAIDNDTDTYLYLVSQLSTSDIISNQDITLIGRLNGITDVADGDFVTIDTSGPEVVVAPARLSSTEISLTVNEAATAGIYKTSDSSLVGASINLTAGNSGILNVAEQTSTITAQLAVTDTVNNTNNLINVHLGTSGDDSLISGGFVFGFGGADTITSGKSGDGASIIDGGLGADIIHWQSATPQILAAKIDSSAGIDIDFSSGVNGDDIFFVSGSDKLQFEEDLLTNAAGTETDTLVKITKGGVVPNTARFVQITDTQASDHTEQFGAAQIVLDALDTSAIAIGDSFIAALDNDTDTYLYLVEQISVSDTIATPDITMIGRLNGITDVVDGDFLTIDTTAPSITTEPKWTSSSLVSLTVNEDSTAGIYNNADSTLVGSSLNLTQGISGSLSVAAQTSVVTGQIKVSDSDNNVALSSYIFLGTTGDDVISGGDILFGFDGADTITGGKGADTIDGGLGADSITGGLDNDTIKFGVEQNVSIFDTFTDANSGDILHFTGSDNGLSSFSNTALAFNTSIAQTITDAVAGDGSVNSTYKWFTDGTDSYVVIDLSADASFVDGTDALIKIAGKANLSDSDFAEADQIIILGSGLTDSSPTFILT